MVLLLLLRFFGGLCGLALSEVLGLDGLDHTDGDGLSHVTHRETTQRREVGERLDGHRLGRRQIDDGGIAGLNELWIIL